MVYYEQPLNERIRTFLRLEHLFQQADYHLAGDTIWDTRATMTSLIDIIAIFNRSDLKTEIIKELERHASNLAKMHQNPAVDLSRLTELLEQLTRLTQHFHGTNGQLGQQLRRNEFLTGITQRSSIPGGTCSFDSPEYHHWLQLPAEERQQTLKHWLSSFDRSRQAIDMLMQITRYSSAPTNEHAKSGFFQETLDSNSPCQFIRVGAADNIPFYVEISGGKHRFVIRFIHPIMSNQTGQTDEDINFELTRCII